VFTDTSAPVWLGLGGGVKVSDMVKVRVSAAALKTAFRSVRYCTENRIWFSEYAVKVADYVGQSV